MIDRLKLPRSELLLVGDGGGSGWQDPAGWGVILIEQATDFRQLFYGGTSAASINFAETIPYLHALSWYHHERGEAILKRFGALTVTIVTDSAFVANNGAVAAVIADPLPRTAQPLWAAYREFVRQGYILQFVWAGRSTSLLNWAADLIATSARKAVKDMGLPKVADHAASNMGEVLFGGVGEVQAALPQINSAEVRNGASPQG